MLEETPATGVAVVGSLLNGYTSTDPLLDFVLTCGTGELLPADYHIRPLQRQGHHGDGKEVGASSPVRELHVRRGGVVEESRETRKPWESLSGERQGARAE